MFGHFRKREYNPTDLTWEERHPIDYLFGPSDEDLKWLRDKIVNEERSILMELYERFRNIIVKKISNY